MSYEPLVGTLRPTATQIPPGSLGGGAVSVQASPRGLIMGASTPRQMAAHDHHHDADRQMHDSLGTHVTTTATREQSSTPALHQSSQANDFVLCFTCIYNLDCCGKV